MKVDNFIKEKLSDRERSDILTRISLALNGNIEFGSADGAQVNIKGVLKKGTSPGVADTEFTVSHNLGYIPTGWLVISIDKASILYKGVTAWTVKSIFLKFNQATVAYVIFIL